MPQATTGFASVKLPTALVNQARDAAQPMRRSVAGQVEYWCHLGPHRGAQRPDRSKRRKPPSANYEAAARRARPTASEPVNQADALLAQFMAVENDGSLAQRVREVVANNRSKAGPATA